MTPVSLRRLALAGMLALLVGGPLHALRRPNLLKTTASRRSEPVPMPGTRRRRPPLVPQDGYMYATGEGVPQDGVEAVAWYRQAAEQGDAKAQYNLGAIYRFGWGVPEDDVEAYKWFNLSPRRCSVRVSSKPSVRLRAAD